jgi:hypothetical protein
VGGLLTFLEKFNGRGAGGHGFRTKLKGINAGVLKLFCIATLFKNFLYFWDPRMLQTSMNLR